MKCISISTIAACLFLLSCNKENNNDVEFYKATVAASRDVSCGTPLLDFSEDSLAIRKLTQSNALRYVVIDLPDSVNVINKKLNVSVRTLKPEEYFVCNDLGISYPPLKILSVKER